MATGSEREASHPGTAGADRATFPSNEESQTLNRSVPPRGRRLTTPRTTHRAKRARPRQIGGYWLLAARRHRGRAARRERGRVAGRGRPRALQGPDRLHRGNAKANASGSPLTASTSCAGMSAWIASSPQPSGSARVRSAQEQGRFSHCAEARDRLRTRNE